MKATAILKSNEKIKKHKELVTRDGFDFMPLIVNEFGQIINDKDRHYLALCEYAYDVALHVYTSSRVLRHFLQQDKSHQKNLSQNRPHYLHQPQSTQNSLLNYM